MYGYIYYHRIIFTRPIEYFTSQTIKFKEKLKLYFK